jgi:hypothetical protein
LAPWWHGWVVDCSCPICRRGFYTQNNAIRHFTSFLQHSYCPAPSFDPRLRRSILVQKVMTKRKTPESPFVCGRCSGHFGSKYLLERHCGLHGRPAACSAIAGQRAYAVDSGPSSHTCNEECRHSASGQRGTQDRRNSQDLPGEGRQRSGEYHTAVGQNRRLVIPIASLVQSLR